MCVFGAMVSTDSISLDFALTAGMLTAVNPSALRPNQVSFFVPVATDVLFSQNPVFAIDNCTFDFTNFRYACKADTKGDHQQDTRSVDLCTLISRRTANDTPITNVSVVFRKANSTTCDRTALQALSADIQRIRDNFTHDYQIVRSSAQIWAAVRLLLEGLTDRCILTSRLRGWRHVVASVVRVPAILRSVCGAERVRSVEHHPLLCRARYASLRDVTCHLSVASYLMERLLTHLGSREYFSDPCCNEGLTWTGSCLPRDVFARNYRGNDFLVAGQCAASACSEQVANSLASGAETLC